MGDLSGLMQEHFALANGKIVLGRRVRFPL